MAGHWPMNTMTSVLHVFNGIYGNGTQLRFVKLLLLYLKNKHIETKVHTKRPLITSIKPPRISKCKLLGAGEW